MAKGGDVPDISVLTSGQFYKATGAAELRRAFAGPLAVAVVRADLHETHLEVRCLLVC